MEKESKSVGLQKEDALNWTRWRVEVGEIAVRVGEIWPSPFRGINPDQNWIDDEEEEEEEEDDDDDDDDDDNDNDDAYTHHEFITYGDAKKGYCYTTNAFSTRMRGLMI